MWGTHYLLAVNLSDSRFIPTHVGNTLWTWTTLAVNCGSSPRMWGTLQRKSSASPEHRFIPTHVGNTMLIPTLMDLEPVHPHACGEHANETRTTRVAPGSSPRMWGTPTHCAQDREKLRFIPTHVGNTIFVLSLQSSVAVHPHACGEHMSTHQKVMNHHGSSPRMWGTHRLCLLMNKDKRFIPTHVGNTVRYAPHHLPYAVHPHACGEHTRAASSGWTQIGSSPRMWGTLVSLPFGLFFCRFIPTHVGNTFGSPQFPAEPSVHPHACGEHHKVIILENETNGSSPRMWGTLFSRCIISSAGRFIPTHVGNTEVNRLRHR